MKPQKHPAYGKPRNKRQRLEARKKVVVWKLTHPFDPFGFELWTKGFRSVLKEQY